MRFMFYKSDFRALIRLARSEPEDYPLLLFELINFGNRYKKLE